MPPELLDGWRRQRRDATHKRPCRAMGKRYFDLNIQRVLEHWSVSEALREIIANALDEQALTNTAETGNLRERSGRWHVRDFGRGTSIRPLHPKRGHRETRGAEPGHQESSGGS